MIWPLYTKNNFSTWKRENILLIRDRPGKVSKDFRKLWANSDILLSTKAGADTSSLLLCLYPL
jgi:hypothetical protein